MIELCKASRVGLLILIAAVAGCNKTESASQQAAPVSPATNPAEGNTSPSKSAGVSGSSIAPSETVTQAAPSSTVQLPPDVVKALADASAAAAAATLPAEAPDDSACVDYPTPEWGTYSAGVSVQGTITSHCRKPVSVTVDYKVFIEDADGKHTIGTGSSEADLQPGEAKIIDIKAPVAEWIREKYPSGYWDVSHSVSVR